MTQEIKMCWQYESVQSAVKKVLNFTVTNNKSL